MYVVLLIFLIFQSRISYQAFKSGRYNTSGKYVVCSRYKRFFRGNKMLVKEKTQSELLFLFAIGIVFVIIMVCRVTNTPMSIKADTEKTVKCNYNTQISQKSERPTQAIRVNMSMPGVVVEAPRVEAICVSDGGKSSIYIQGKFAYEGDIIDGFKILKIYANRVDFEKDGQSVTSVFPQP